MPRQKTTMKGTRSPVLKYFVMSSILSSLAVAQLRTERRLMKMNHQKSMKKYKMGYNINGGKKYRPESMTSPGGYNVFKMSMKGMKSSSKMMYKGAKMMGTSLWMNKGKLSR